MSMLLGASTGGLPTRPPYGQSMSKSQSLGRRYQPFANPFFDLASTYTPTTVRGLFAYCRHYYLTHGIINAICTKAAEYPVTDLILQHASTGVVQRWEALLHGTVNYRVFQFETNLDYYVYGNAFISPKFPFRKVLTCEGCKREHTAAATKSYWRFTSHKFWLTCPDCQHSGFAEARDDYYPKASELGLIRWNPEDISIAYNEATGDSEYSLRIPERLRTQINMGVKDTVARTPSVFLDAVRFQKSLVFDKNALFHLRRPCLSSMDRGWGIPLLMPVLKDAFYMQVMKKAQESVLLTHLEPQVFLFPQPATAGADPFSTANLVDWQEHLRRELARQRIDPSYYGILPFPLGHQTIGEHGRSLLLMPEIQQLGEMISVGMGFPPDLSFGNGTFAGSSVSMRMLENFFLSNVSAHYRLVQWVIDRFGAFLNWQTPEARFKPFRMADDIQRQALLLQYNQAGKISDTTLLSMSDLKPEDEAKLIVKDTAVLKEAAVQQQLLQAEIAGRTQVVAAKFQAKAQQALAEAEQRSQMSPDPWSAAVNSDLSGPGGISLDAATAAFAKRIRQMPDDQRDVFMRQIQAESPDLANAVNQQLQQQQPGGAPTGPGNEGSPVDMRPMPEALPPRRASAQM